MENADTYSWLRGLADSWFLVAMFVFFLGAVAWAFRPGSRKAHDDAANIPMRDDDPRRPKDPTVKES